MMLGNINLYKQTIQERVKNKLVRNHPDCQIPAASYYCLTMFVLTVSFAVWMLVAFCTHDISDRRKLRKENMLSVLQGP